MRQFGAVGSEELTTYAELSPEQTSSYPQSAAFLLSHLPLLESKSQHCREGHLRKINLCKMCQLPSIIKLPKVKCLRGSEAINHTTGVDYDLVTFFVIIILKLQIFNL